MNRLRVAMIQVNSVVGDLEGNVARVRSALGEVVDCDVAVFPEMVLTGYPLEDLVLKPRFVADSRAAMETLAAESGDCALVLGFADPGPEGSVHNAVAVCRGGAVVGVYHKRMPQPGSTNGNTSGLSSARATICIAIITSLNTVN